MSRACRGGSRVFDTTPVLGPPEAVTIVGAYDEFDRYVITVTVAPSFPDPGGTWDVETNNGTGWGIDTEVSIDDVHHIPTDVDANVTPEGTLWRVIQNGGGVLFTGQSPPSNIVVQPPEI